MTEHICKICHGNGEALDPEIREMNICHNCKGAGYMEKVVVWYSIRNDGAGAAYLKWVLTKEEAREDQRNMDEGWGETCIGSVETFIGSDIHTSAVENVKKRKRKSS